MSPFLTVKEAAQLTGKSTSSIRRVIYPIIHDDQHPDRGEIQPDIAQVRELRMKGENFAWRVSEELLRREVRVEPPSPPHAKLAEEGSSSHANTALLSMLRAELEIKNGQIVQQSELIGKQMELISGLSERLREGNILIGGLQKQLSLPSPRSRSTSETRATKSGKTSTQEKGSQASGNTVKPKRGLFGWMFP
jgi:hypothetical protein